MTYKIKNKPIRLVMKEKHQGKWLSSKFMKDYKHPETASEEVAVWNSLSPKRYYLKVEEGYQKNKWGIWEKIF